MNETRQPLIEIRKIKKFFPLKKKNILQRKQFFVRANEDVSLIINKGETLGLVGESGCGKSTLGKVILQLYEPTSGSALYYGVPLREANPRYVLNDIKKLPSIQKKAQRYFNKSLEYDKKITELEEELKEGIQQELKEKSNQQINLIHDQIIQLKELEKRLIEETIEVLKESAEDYKKQNPEIEKVGKGISWENEVTKVLNLLAKDDGKNGVSSYIDLLHIPHQKVTITYKKVIKLREDISELRKKEEELSKTKLERLIEKLKHKSKELKKEASRQLRIGSETAGEFILEADLPKIAQLMLEEELLHRDIFNKKQQLKKQIKYDIEIEKALKQEIEAKEIEKKKIVEEIESYHFKNVLPITERCENPEYQKKLEGNRQYAINLQKLNKEEIRRLRQKLQMIFQDPYSSLDPRMTVGQAISEAVVEHGLYEKNSPDLEKYIIETMAKCGLDHYMIHRYPHQFSGGQRQRIVIARALALKPEFVVCDESVSALDVSIQSQILNLLEDLKEKNDLTYLFISHDLSVIKHISDRIGVMYLGNLVELCAAEELYERALHPYSKALISAIPTTTQDKKERIILEGDIPSNIFPPSGCKFRTRCPLAREKCAKDSPKLLEVEPNHFVACHFYEETKNLK